MYTDFVLQLNTGHVYAFLNFRPSILPLSLNFSFSNTALSSSKFSVFFLCHFLFFIIPPHIFFLLTLSLFLFLLRFFPYSLTRLLPFYSLLFPFAKTSLSLSLLPPASPCRSPPPSPPSLYTTIPASPSFPPSLLLSPTAPLPPPLLLLQFHPCLSLLPGPPKSLSSLPSCAGFPSRDFCPSGRCFEGVTLLHFHSKVRVVQGTTHESMSSSALTRGIFVSRIENMQLTIKGEGFADNDPVPLLRGMARLKGPRLLSQLYG